MTEGSLQRNFHFSEKFLRPITLKDTPVVAFQAAFLVSPPLIRHQGNIRASSKDFSLSTQVAFFALAAWTPKCCLLLSRLFSHFEVAGALIFVSALFLNSSLPIITAPGKPHTFRKESLS